MWWSLIRTASTRARPETVPPSAASSRKAIADYAFPTGLCRRLTAILIVPSALAPAESNWLINPRHADFSKVRVHPAESFEYDPRFFK